MLKLVKKQPIIANFPKSRFPIPKSQKNYKVSKIKRKSSGLDLYYGGESEFFDYDKVILATHADEALKLIENPSEDEKKILSNFRLLSDL